MRTMTRVADRYDISLNKFFKNSGQHYGRLCEPVVYELEEDMSVKYVLKAETYHGCADVALIDYDTSDYHLFDTKRDAINAWVGRVPTGTNWNH